MPNELICSECNTTLLKTNWKHPDGTFSTVWLCGCETPESVGPKYAQDNRPRARVSCPSGYTSDFRVDVLGEDGEYHQIKYMNYAEIIADGESGVVMIKVTMMLTNVDELTGEVKLDVTTMVRQPDGTLMRESIE